MQLLRGIGRSLPRCRAQVVFNACVHLSGRVARLEEPDDPGVLVYGGKHIVQSVVKFVGLDKTKMASNHVQEAVYLPIFKSR